MNQKKYIFAKEAEYLEFITKGSKQNKIRLFLKEVINSLPSSLQKEIRSIATNLKPYKGELDIEGAIAFTFKASEASNELQKALNNFVVLVENDTQEIIDWKESIKHLKHSYLRG